ncbi:hypothetical protein J1614_004310 [Plenodomus biglobosus]|nr:hypothetical protein J1614_004310 [Plenodomus biglobosus]
MRLMRGVRTREYQLLCLRWNGLDMKVTLLAFVYVHFSRLLDLQNLSIALVSALQILPAARLLPAKTGGKTLFDSLARLHSAISSHLDVDRIKPLWNVVLKNDSDHEIWSQADFAATESTPPPHPSLPFQQTPLSINTGSITNSTEYRRDLDNVMKEELPFLYVGIPGFFDAFFGDVTGLRLTAQAVFRKCQDGDRPLYQLGSGWKGWPQAAKEKDVIDWFVPLTDQLLDLAEGHPSASRVRRRLLAQPHHPIQGSTANRKLDLGIVDDLDIGVNSKWQWSHIRIPGELKSNPLADKASNTWLDLARYAKEVFAAQDSRRFVLCFTLCGSIMRLWSFDRLGGIASAPFDINTEGLQFVSVMLGFLWMDEERLGYDPTIIAVGNKRYFEIERAERKERLVIDQVIKRVACVAGRATTCWTAHAEDDPGTPLVVKDSWQYPEREEEGELLHEATRKKVVNVARYYHHETVRVRDRDDDITTSVRKGLDITKATNYKAAMSTPLSSTTGPLVWRRSSSSTAGMKRSSSSAGLLLLPSKRIYQNSLPQPMIMNRIHRRVIVRDYGKPIYKASSPTRLLAAFERCIEGYESLHTRGGMLQRDISLNNLLVNEDEENPSWPAFLIDLDMAIKEQREKSSGALGRTGTRAFMAIGVLLNDEQHSFMHDLESFFWVLLWICIHYDGPGQAIGSTMFEMWNYESSEQLADLKKGLISDETDFVKTIEAKFTDYYKPLTSHVNKLRKKVFPGGGRWRKPALHLYEDMKNVLRDAQREIEASKE